MLITITNTKPPATDIGYMLGKHPDRHQSFEMSYGRADVFYPEASEARCTVAVALHLNQVDLARSKDRRLPPQSSSYINDIAYTASSQMGMTLNKLFRAAAAGVCKEKPELPETEMPLEVNIPVLALNYRRPQGQHKGTEQPEELCLPHTYFKPLGYEVKVTRHPLDAGRPEWGEAPQAALTLKHEITLKSLLNHLSVLIPAMDGGRTAWITDNEVEALLRLGTGWLEQHPARTRITRRFLRNNRDLTANALKSFQDTRNPEQAPEPATEEPAPPPTLAMQRAEAVCQALLDENAQSVIDIGAGEGRLTLELLKRPQFAKIAAYEASLDCLHIIRRRAERAPSEQTSRLTLLHGSITHVDPRTAGYDAAAVMEVIEHIDLDRLPDFEYALFATARPKAVIITTPNQEYNEVYSGMDPDRMRHHDHRFEWTRSEFQEWAGRTAARYGYQPEHRGIGDNDQDRGQPTQMVIFRKI